MQRKIAKRAAAPRKSTGKRATTAAKTTTATATAKTPAAKDMLTAGIRALSSARDEAMARQRGVFESLFGLGGKRDAQPGDGGSAVGPSGLLDPFGVRKFEDVFDQRVARAMERLGAADAETVAAMRAELERLAARVATLEAAARKR